MKKQAQSQAWPGQEDASMYNAWVGPLELGACEYRFQALGA